MKRWKQGRVLLAQPLQRRQIPTFGRIIPFAANLCEGVFGRGTPEDVLAAIMVGDQRMLQSDPIGNRTNTCPLETRRGKFSDRGVEDRHPRLDGALLFGSLARTTGPNGYHLGFLYHLVVD
jgi:hypothetical protein